MQISEEFYERFLRKNSGQTDTEYFIGPSLRESNKKIKTNEKMVRKSCGILKT